MRPSLAPQSILTGYLYAGLVAGTGLVASVHWLAGKPGGWFSLWFLSAESLAIVLASAGVGFSWGVVHLGLRSAASHLGGDQNRLDFCDFSISPDSTA